MSKIALHWFHSLYRRGTRLKPITWRILECLVLVHSVEHGCFPSQAYIARQVGVSLRTVNTHLGKLERAGLIARQRRGAPHAGRLQTTAYHFPFESSFDRFRIPADAVENPVDSQCMNTLSGCAVSASAPMQKLQTSPETDNNTSGIGHGPRDAVVERCLHACGPGLCARSRRLIRGTDAVLWSWLERGYSLEKDILPALRKKTARRSGWGHITSWAYFNNAVAETHAKRIARENPGVRGDRNRKTPISDPLRLSCAWRRK